MAKKKAELLEDAKALGLELSEKNTVAEITAAIKDAGATTKAGKRSAKAIKEEVEETERKEKAKSRKATDEKVESATKKGPIPTPRPKSERRSKGYKAAAKKLDGKDKSLTDAVKLAIETSTTKFDGTVEMHVRLAVDPKHADQNIRDTIVLPSGTGKSVRVGVFAPADEHKSAKEAGADVVGEDDLLEKFKAGEFDFDTLIATPKVMAKLGQFAKVLGPKGLMPSPKAGTVTNEIAEAVKQAKAGRVEYRVDAEGIIHLAIGKVSFGSEKILVNAEALLASIKSNKPASVKDNYITSVYLTTTMGPSIRVEV